MTRVYTLDEKIQIYNDNLKKQKLHEFQNNIKNTVVTRLALMSKYGDQKKPSDPILDQFARNMSIVARVRGISVEEATQEALNRMRTSAFKEKEQRLQEHWDN